VSFSLAAEKKIVVSFTCHVLDCQKVPHSKVYSWGSA